MSLVLGAAVTIKYRGEIIAGVVTKITSPISANILGFLPSMRSIPEIAHTLIVPIFGVLFDHLDNSLEKDLSNLPESNFVLSEDYPISPVYEPSPRPVVEFIPIPAPAPAPIKHTYNPESNPKNNLRETELPDIPGMTPLDKK